MQVDGDREVFSSVRDFKDFVTPEALRRFEGIAIHADGSEVKADVSLRRLRPWWQPGLGNDTIVVVTTSGADEEQAATAFDGLYAAVRRGGTETGGR